MRSPWLFAYREGKQIVFFRIGVRRILSRRSKKPWRVYSWEQLRWKIMILKQFPHSGPRHDIYNTNCPRTLGSEAFNHSCYRSVRFFTICSPYCSNRLFQYVVPHYCSNILLQYIVPIYCYNILFQCSSDTLVWYIDPVYCSQLFQYIVSIYWFNIWFWYVVPYYSFTFPACSWSFRLVSYHHHHHFQWKIFIIVTKTIITAVTIWVKFFSWTLRPQTFVPTVGESLLLAYIQSASDLYGPMLQG